MTRPSAMDRREAIKRVGILAGAPVAFGYHPFVPVQPGGASWQPVFLSATEAELVAALAEHIIPETESPGARTARVHEFIDLVLSEAPVETGAAFRRGLEGFADQSPSRQVELLDAGQDGEFFGQLKELTIQGYYGSEVGMKRELGFEGRSFVTEFEGCRHPEHLSWSPPDVANAVEE